ncbi:MAG: type IX secretion system sortase PorU, partial [Candidatus Zixiibacteriota bacterium]
YRCTYQTTALVDGLNEMNLKLWPETYAPPYFDYMNLEYTSRLTSQDNALDLTLGTFAGEAQIEVVDNFNYPVVVLDLANPLQPAVLTGYERAGGQITLRAQLTTESPNRFYLATIQQALGPLSIERVSPADLRDTTQQVDLLIVTPKKFAEAMDEYLDYRRAQGYSIAVVSIEDIMDNFGYGLYDPTAIRDFLKYAYEYYPLPAPSAVLLVGDGNYDFLDHLGTGVTNYVPPYIHAYDESASDDNYVYFGVYGILDSDTSYVTQDRGYDMTIARWPVRSRDEINVIVAKAKRYESPSSLGIWRTNISLVADDEHFVRNNVHVFNEAFHTTQTEELEKEHIPPLFHRNKIYLWEYPFVNWKKPTVNDAIVNAINDGTLLVNFVGHGNPDVWAHEEVFTRMGDLPRLSNYDQLALFFNASCALGFFDDPKREGMAEDLLVHRTGGAVGVISATRQVWSSDNAQFNQKVYDVLLNNDSLSIGEAVYTAKLLRQYDGSPVPSPEKNDRAYLFFGDPYMKLGTPQLGVEFSDTPDSLTALGRTHISGSVLDKQDQPYERDGTLVINVCDSERKKSYWVGNQKIDYSVTGPTIFRGSASIIGGFFDFEFVSPLDIGYGGQGAKIVVYAIFDSTDAAGLIDSLMVSDSIVTLADSVGPTIEYAFPGRANFVTGDFVSRKDLLEVTLSDSTGINLTGGLGHGITLELDGRSENTINLTDRFEYNQDDYTSGKLAHPLEDVEPGRHTFKIKAWDNANNSATVEFAAEVIVEENLAIIDLLNYPNPMKDSTRFSAYLSHPVERFLLEIFTLSGRKIRTFGSHRPPPGYFDDIIWYGRDNSGDRVATGVYIYKATAIPVAGGNKVESFGKVVVIN